MLLFFAARLKGGDGGGLGEGDETFDSGAADIDTVVGKLLFDLLHDGGVAPFQPGERAEEDDAAVGGERRLEHGGNLLGSGGIFQFGKAVTGGPQQDFVMAGAVESG